MTLDEMHQLKLDIIAKVDLCVRGQAFVNSREAKIRLFGSQWDADTLKAERELLADRGRRLAALETEIDELDQKMLEAWTFYLRAQPNGQIKIKKGNGDAAIISARPIMNPPCEVWLPQDICVLTRIHTIYAGPFKDLGPVQMMEQFADKLDPLTQLRKERLKRGKAAAGGMFSAAETTPVDYSRPPETAGLGAL